MLTVWQILCSIRSGSNLDIKELEPALEKLSEKQQKDPCWENVRLVKELELELSYNDSLKKKMSRDEFFEIDSLLQLCQDVLTLILYNVYTPLFLKSFIKKIDELAGGQKPYSGYKPKYNYFGTRCPYIVCEFESSLEITFYQLECIEFTPYDFNDLIGELKHYYRPEVIEWIMNIVCMNWQDSSQLEDVCYEYPYPLYNTYESIIEETDIPSSKRNYQNHMCPSKKELGRRSKSMELSRKLCEDVLQKTQVSCY